MFPVSVIVIVPGPGSQVRGDATGVASSVVKVSRIRNVIPNPGVANPLPNKANRLILHLDVDETSVRTNGRGQFQVEQGV